MFQINRDDDKIKTDDGVTVTFFRFYNIHAKLIKNFKINLKKIGNFILFGMAAILLSILEKY